MIDLSSLAIHFIEQYLLIDKEDMVVHSFLWSLANSTSVETKDMAVDCYRRLAPTDIKAAHKLAALTGEGTTTSCLYLHFYQCFNLALT